MRNCCGWPSSPRKVQPISWQRRNQKGGEGSSLNVKNSGLGKQGPMVQNVMILTEYNSIFIGFYFCCKMRRPSSTSIDHGHLDKTSFSHLVYKLYMLATTRGIVLCWGRNLILASNMFSRFILFWLIGGGLETFPFNYFGLMLKHNT